jgi:hemerythrin-like domain-containing protein
MANTTKSEGMEREGKGREGLLARMFPAGSGKEPNEGIEKATDLLKSQHDEVRQLFKEFENAGERAAGTKKRAIDEASRKLEVHAELEEKVFYPACRELKDEKAREMVGESLEEHLIVKRLIKELSGLSGSDEKFEAKATVLKESVEHHADEEESDLFPIAEKELGDEQLEELGARMAAMKERLTAGKGTVRGKRPTAAARKRPKSKRR